MGLFKSKDERRIEREMKIRGGLRAIEKSIRQQEKFSEDFIKNAQHAKKIGDNGQYLFIRSALKKTAAVKKMLERQLLAIKNAMLIQQQAQASQQFAESMNLMAKEISRVFGEMDLTQTQAQWERAVAQAGSIEERMEPELAEEIYLLDRCIECGCCVAGCGTARMREDFVGAVGINKIARFRLDPRDARTDEDYYEVIGDDSGVFGCMSLLACHDVCPKDLPLQTQIAFIRRKMVAMGWK